MSKTILITGGAGFFGSILKKRIIKTRVLFVSVDIEKSGSKSKLVHMPKQFMEIGMKICYMLGISPLGPYQYKMICSNFIFDTTKTKRELGFTSTLKNEFF